MQAIQIALPEGAIEGSLEPGWDGLLDAFVANFRTGHELGAALCVRHEGRVVADLWGGFADRAGTPWREDNLGVVFSATKAATALCAHLLADVKAIDLNQRVTHYWPEYGANGKAETTVAMLLDHSAGVPGFREPLPEGAFADWDYMIGRIEQEAPWWQPGLQNGYHLLNIGWTVGEVVRRVSGLSLGRFFQSHVAEPVGADFWIGLPEELESRLVEIQPNIAGEFWDFAADPLPLLAASDPSHRAVKALSHLGGFIAYDEDTGHFSPNDRAVHAAEIGGAGGITNARGLAAMYDPLANGGGTLIGSDTIWRMSQVAMVSHKDAILQSPTRFALGFMKSTDNRSIYGEEFQSVILGDRAFGHPGAGGSLGFADPDCGLAFGYMMNRMGPGSFVNARAQSLVDAAYLKLGYRSKTGGVWAR